MISLCGVRKRGGGSASKNLKIQIPLIKREFPEIASVHPGTINLHLEKPLLVLAADYRTKPIDWGDKEGEPGEVFDLVRIRFETVEPRNSTNAWLYIAHGSEHRRDLHVHEIIAPFMSLNGDANCKIHVSRNHIELAYRQFPLVVIL
jgi:hypothetical protein